MTANQIAYQNFLEARRHNLATEALSSAVNDVNRQHYERQDSASFQQAIAAGRNAATNERNAAINEFNADTNRLNAQTAAYNAESQRLSAQAQASQATSAARQASVAERNVSVTEQQSPSIIGRNESSARQSDAAAFQSTSHAISEDPVGAGVSILFGGAPALPTLTNIRNASVPVVKDVVSYATKELVKPVVSQFINTQRKNVLRKYASQRR